MALQIITIQILKGDHGFDGTNFFLKKRKTQKGGVSLEDFPRNKKGC